MEEEIRRLRKENEELRNTMNGSLLQPQNLTKHPPEEEKEKTQEHEEKLSPPKLLEKKETSGKAQENELQKEKED